MCCLSKRIGAKTEMEKELASLWAKGLSNATKELLDDSQDCFDDFVKEHWSNTMIEIFLRVGGENARNEWSAMSKDEQVQKLQGKIFSFEQFQFDLELIFET